MVRPENLTVPEGEENAIAAANRATKTVKHIKKMPECKNVTKHHCVTKWEVLPSGEKVRILQKSCNLGKLKTR